jgi:hypothetical protein
MSNFMQLTDPEGKMIMININSISSIHCSETYPLLTVVETTNSLGDVYVKESMNDIKLLLIDLGNKVI